MPVERRDRVVAAGATIAAVAVAYVLVRIAWAPGPGPVRSHLTDLMAGVALPAVMALCAAAAGRGEAWVASLGGKLALTASATLVWEGVVPLATARSTADPLDVLAYLAGTLLHHAGQRGIARVRARADDQPS